MPEKIIIKDEKKRKLYIIGVVIVFCLSWLIHIHGIKIHNTSLEALGAMFCFFFIPILAMYFYPVNDLIKIENENICCKSSKIKSKYVSFFGNVKIPIAEISLIYLNKSEGLIDIYDIDSQRIASIQSLGLFSSEKYFNDIKNYLMQKSIEVHISTREEDLKHHKTVTSNVNDTIHITNTLDKHLINLTQNTQAEGKKVNDTIANMDNDLKIKFLSTIVNRDYEKAKVYLDAGINLNIKKDIDSVLPITIEDERPDIVELLLKHGADPNFQQDGIPILFVAVGKQSYKIVELLLKYGANPNSQRDGISILFFAMSLNNAEIVELLLKYGSDPNSQEKGMSILSYAVIEQSCEIVEILLKYGADPNSQENGLSVLLHAVIEKSCEVVGLLLKYGADPEYKTPEGNTSLIRATELGYVEIVKLLLQYGVNLSAKNNNGASAIDIATEQKNETIINIFKKYGGMNVKDNDGAKRKLAKHKKNTKKSKKTQENKIGRNIDLE